MASFTTQRAEVDPFRAVFVATTDAVRLRSSCLSVHKRRFKGNRRNRVDVDRDDSRLIDSLKCTNTPLVDAKGGDVDTSKESCRACMVARVAIVLELHSRALLFLKVDSP